MQARIAQILSEIDVTINGNKPQDIQVHDSRFYTKLLKQGSVGAGEAYMEGMWDCKALDELFFRICRHQLYNKFYSPWQAAFLNFKNTLINQQTQAKSQEVANRHYNLGNTLYECMLGKSMAYTCGYWKEANNLDEAEFAKYDLICRKLALKPKDFVLEVGCGWGGFAKYMAEKFGCQVVAIDIAAEPAAYAKKLCQDLPVEIYHCDYRETASYNPKNKLFDKIVSVGVLEHIGFKNYPELIRIMRGFLNNDGMALLHSIGGNASRKFCDPWIDKYIFPHGMLPSLMQLGRAYEKQFIVEDYHNFGIFYNKTLKAWHANFNAHWDTLKNIYDERFRRMMNYYLLSCAGGFLARDMQLWQFVLTPKGLLEYYNSIR